MYRWGDWKYGARKMQDLLNDGPKISTAIGWKTWVLSKTEYSPALFRRRLRLQCRRQLRDRQHAVTCQVSGSSSFHNTIVRPSGHLPSDLVSPWGSLVTGRLQRQRHGQLDCLLYGAWPFRPEIFANETVHPICTDQRSTLTLMWDTKS